MAWRGKARHGVARQLKSERDFMNATEYLKDYIISNGLTYITPEQIVAMAEAPDSPMHGYFQWDDQAAAHQYRLWQARQLIASIKITVEGAPDTNIRLMVSVPSDRGVNGYQLLSEAIKNPAARKTLLDEMTSKVEHWRSQAELISSDTLVWLDSFPHIVRTSRPKHTPRKAVDRKDKRQRVYA